jgi:hypothetical protein
MSEMRDRVARAMEDTWDAAELGGRLGPITALILARAAIEEMRKPSFMLADAIQKILAEYVLEDGETSVSRDEASEILGRIIDAALKT